MVSGSLCEFEIGVVSGWEVSWREFQSVEERWRGGGTSKG